MLFQFLLHNEQGIGEINFNGAGVIGCCFHEE
jgi:hypothetical protein